MTLLAFFLVNLPFTLATSQLKIVVLDQGLNDATAALMVSIFAMMAVVGRMASGVLLDYLPAPAIAAVGFGLPVIGLVMLATPFDSVLIVGIAIGLCGISFGGEGDVVPYLVTQYFPMRVFSSVLGLMSAAIGGAMAAGNAVLAVVLARTDSFNLYLIIAAVSAFIGSTIFLMLGTRRFRPAAPLH